MERQLLLDKLSEFLAVEQGGLELYRVAEARSTDDAMKEKYREFGRETAHHRDVLTRLIRRLGGDPNHISPTARLAQVKAAGLLDATLRTDGLSHAEIEVNDLENLLLAETKDQADWALLEQLAGHADGEVKEALDAAVEEVGAQEDEHLQWAREMLAERCLRMALDGPAPSPERWQQAWSNPQTPIEQVHPQPIDTGELEPSAREHFWGETPIARAVEHGR